MYNNEENGTLNYWLSLVNEAVQFMSGSVWFGFDMKWTKPGQANNRANFGHVYVYALKFPVNILISHILVHVQQALNTCSDNVQCLYCMQQDYNGQKWLQKYKEYKEYIPYTRSIRYKSIGGVY